MSRRLWLPHQLLDLAWGRADGRATARHDAGPGAGFPDQPNATDTNYRPATAATRPGGESDHREGAGAGTRPPPTLQLLQAPVRPVRERGEP